MRRVLFLAYIFPPAGGAGVQRAVKFVKYLPECGWMPTVLTVSNPSVPVHDDSLAVDIPSEVKVTRVRTWEPSYAAKSLVSANREPSASHNIVKTFVRRMANLALQPDPQILYVPNAIRAGRQMLAAEQFDVILATAPPFSAFLIGSSLSRRFGVPLVLDYRDEWDITNAHSENRRGSALANRIQQRMQRQVVRTAKGIIATTHRSASALESVRDAAGSTAKVSWIYNGFDPEDFADSQPESQPENTSARAFRLAYVGTLWNLTSVAPLVSAVSRLRAKYPEQAGRLEIVLAGRRTAEQEELIRELRPLCRLIERPYLDHDQAIRLMRSADALCLLLSDLPEASRCVPAKLFEYMATRRTIFAVTPPGEVWDLLRDYPDAYLCPPDDPGLLADGLAATIDREPLDAEEKMLNWNGSAFSRRSQAAELANFLESMTDHT